MTTRLYPRPAPEACHDCGKPDPAKKLKAPALDPEQSTDTQDVYVCGKCKLPHVVARGED